MIRRLLISLCLFFVLGVPVVYGEGPARLYIFEGGDRSLYITNPTGIIETIFVQVWPMWSGMATVDIPPDSSLVVPSTLKLGVTLDDRDSHVFVLTSCYPFYLWTWVTDADGGKVLTPVYSMGVATNLDCNDGGGGNAGSQGSSGGSGGSSGGNGSGSGGSSGGSSGSGSGSSGGGVGDGSGSGSGGGNNGGGSGGSGSGGSGDGGSGGSGDGGSGGSGSGGGGSSGGGGGSNGGGGEDLPKHCTDGHGLDGLYNPHCQQ